jgi:hypothetical protein
VLFVVGYFAGYRTGYDSGFGHITANAVYTEIYPVEDLVTPFDGGRGRREAEYETLIALLEAAVFPNDWDEIRKIRTIENRKQIVISHTRDGHDRIRKLLEQARKQMIPFNDRIKQGKCPYCGNAPLPPNLGDRCTHCNTPRHQPVSQTPKLTVIRP